MLRTFVASLSALAALAPHSAHAVVCALDPVPGATLLLPYFELDASQARVTGNASCNRFFGTYDITTGNRLRFGPNIGSTMMACPELEREREFLEMLTRVDNYSIGDGMLSLNRARMAPLARFRSVQGER